MNGTCVRDGAAIIVMGVSGAGKSLIARQLADALEAPLVEADDHHSQANRDKMAAGVALTDEDRWPWLDAVGSELGRLARNGGVAVAACSALKADYRLRLEQTAGLPIRFVHLDGPSEVLAARLSSRKGHFMNPALLDSQLATLEPPRGANVLTCAITDPPKAIIARIMVWLPGLNAGS